MGQLPRRCKTDVEGLFYRDFASGRIYYAVYRDPTTGKQREVACRNSTTRKPLTLAQSRRHRARLVSGTDVNPVRRRRSRNGETVRSYYERWRTTYRGRTKAGIRSDGLHQYCVHIERHFLPEYGDTPLAEFDAADLRQVADRIATYADNPERRARGDTRHVESVRKAIGPFRRMYACAVEESTIPVNRLAGVRIAPPDTHRTPSAQAVADGAQLPSTGRDHARALSGPQLKAVVAEIPIGYRLLIAVIAATGVRLSEAFGWLVGDFDAEAGILRVRRTWRVVTVANGVRVGQYRELKTEYALRDLPLPAALRDQLVRHVASLPAGAATPLFPDTDGTPLKQDHLRRIVLIPAAKRAGVPWARLHTLRHTFASIQVRNGADLKRLQIMMGHQDPAYTLSRYVHLFHEDLPVPPTVFAELAAFEVVPSGQTWAPSLRRTDRQWTLEACRRAITKAQKESGRPGISLADYAELQRGCSDLPTKSTIIRIAAANGTSFGALRDGVDPSDVRRGRRRTNDPS